MENKSDKRLMSLEASERSGEVSKIAVERTEPEKVLPRPDPEVPAKATRGRFSARYKLRILEQADGDAIADADVRRLSSLVHKHLNFLGRYHFSLPGDVRGGVLRELRDPNAGLEEEWLLPVGSP